MIEMIQALEAGLLLTLYLIPLLSFWGGFGFEQIKVFAFIILTTINGSIWLYLLHKRQLTLQWTTLKKLSALFIGILLISSLLGLDISGSFLGKDPYYQGWIFYCYLYLYAWMVSSIPKRLNLWLMVITLSAVIVSLVAIKEWLEIHLFNMAINTYAGRVISTFGQPNLYSGFLILTLPFIYQMTKINQLPVKRFAIASLIVSLLAIIISYSRAAIILAGFLSLGWVFVKYNILDRIPWCFFACVVIFVSIFVGFTILRFYDVEIDQPQRTEWLIDNSPEKRIYLWGGIFISIFRRPILGYGLENIAVAFPTYQPYESRPPQFHKLKDLTIDRSHNYLLDLLVYAGAVGLLSWILMVGKMFRSSNTKTYLIVLVLYLIWTQIQIQSVVHLLYFWFLQGLLDNPLQSELILD